MAVTLLLGIVGAVVARLIADELKALAPWITEKLINVAVSQLGGEQRDRYSEEWSSHIHEIPGDLTKIGIALGFLLAARRMVRPVHKQIQRTRLMVILKVSHKLAILLRDTSVRLTYILAGCISVLAITLIIPVLLFDSLLDPRGSSPSTLQESYGSALRLTKKGLGTH